MFSKFLVGRERGEALSFSLLKITAQQTVVLAAEIVWVSTEFYLSNSNFR